MRTELAVARKAAAIAGKIMLERLESGLSVERKPDGSPVTNADKECENAIMVCIRAEFPDAQFLSEETHPENFSPKTKWIVDPIDGTRNFVRGIPSFGSIIGFEENGEIVAGVVTNPSTGLELYAERGGGAWANGKRAHVSSCSRREDAAIVFGTFRRLAATPQGPKVIEWLSKAAQSRGFGDILDLQFLVTGRTDVLLEAGGHPWDQSAFKIIVEEAGGKWTDASGKAGIYSMGLMVAANPALHAQALDFLNSSGKE